MQQNPIIIIGAGMAGYTLARELRKHSPQITIILICQDAGDSYSKPSLSNAFAQQKQAQQLIIANAKQMADTLNLQILNHHVVTEIDKKNKKIYLKNLINQSHQCLNYRQLVLATGTKPKTLPMVKVDNQRIFAINHLDEYQKFQQKIQQVTQSSQNQPINLVIIGAGLIGCEFANDLALTHHVKITVIDQASYPLVQQIPSVAGELLQQRLTETGIDFKFNTQIQHIDCQEKIQLKFVNNKNPKEVQQISADMLLLAIGLSANVALAQQAQLALAEDNGHIEHCLPKTAQQGILVNQFLQTSADDIYAIGDCANVMNSHLPYVMPLMCQAKALAKTLADGFIDDQATKTAVVYPAMPVAVKTPSCPLVILPIPAKFVKQVQWQQQITDDGLILTAYQQNSEQLIGFVLVGKEAVKQRMGLTKLAMDYLPIR